jgi:hypothetical protein
MKNKWLVYIRNKYNYRDVDINIDIALIDNCCSYCVHRDESMYCEIMNGGVWYTCTCSSFKKKKGE